MKKNEYSYKTLLTRPETHRAGQQKRASVEQPPRNADKISKQLQLASCSQALLRPDSTKRYTAPTTAFHSQRDMQLSRPLNPTSYNSNKENDVRSINRTEPSQDYNTNNSGKPNKEFKLYTEADEERHTTSLQQMGGVTQNSIIKVLKEKISKLEGQLTRKISDHGLMKFFTTSNSSTNYNHIDIYLQLMGLERKCQEMKNTINDQKQQISKLSQETEKSTVSHTQEIMKCNTVIDKLKSKLQDYQSLQDQHNIANINSNNYEQKYQELRVLFEEASKSKAQASRRSKELEDKIVALGEEKRSLEDLVEKMNVRTIEIEQRYAELQNNFEEVLADKVSKDQDLQAVRQKVMQLEAELNKHKAELNSQSSKLHNKEQQSREHAALCKTMEENTAILKSDMEQISRRYKNQGKQLQKLKSEGQELKNQEAALLKQLKEREQEAKLQTQNILKHQNREAKYLAELDTLRTDLRKAQEEVEKQQNRWETVNNRKQANEKYRLIAKIKDISAKVSKQMGAQLVTLIQNKSAMISSQDEIEKALCILDCTVETLLEEVLGKMKKQMQNARLNLQSLEMERECLIEERDLQLSSKNECIRQLLNIYVYDSKAQSIAQEYVGIVGEILQDCTNDKINRKLELIGVLDREASRVKQVIEKAESKKSIQMKDSAVMTDLVEASGIGQNTMKSLRAQFTDLGSIRKSLGGNRPSSIRKYYDQ